TRYQERTPRTARPPRRTTPRGSRCLPNRPGETPEIIAERQAPATASMAGRSDVGQRPHGNRVRVSWRHAVPNMTRAVGQRSTESARGLEPRTTTGDALRGTRRRGRLDPHRTFLRRLPGAAARP